MNAMKQNIKVISLRDFTDTPLPNGNIQGKETFKKLFDYINSHSEFSIFGISLKDIKATDVSFPRECVVSIAKYYRGEKGFYLEGMSKEDRDLFDNWKYAAYAKEQPLVIWYEDSYEIVGPEISSSNLEMINYVLDKKSVTTSKIAEELNISVANASTKLKKLVEQGYIMRSEVSAETGGKEFIYHAIK